jgi:hypothetical protein
MSHKVPSRRPPRATWHQAGAVLLALPAACATTPRQNAPPTPKAQLARGHLGGVVAPEAAETARQAMIQFSDREIKNERLVLDSKTEVYYLGHDLTLRNCTLVLKVPAKALAISRTHLIDCVIEVKQELKKFTWDHAHLKGCRFKGRLNNCDFGQWPDLPAGTSSIQDCDFTEAVLDGCRFIGCDISKIQLPSWPCFTILEPFKRRSELLEFNWPGEVRLQVQSFRMYPETTAAVTLLATTIAKKLGTTEEALKAIVEQVPGVKY